MQGVQPDQLTFCVKQRASGVHEHWQLGDLRATLLAYVAENGAEVEAAAPDTPDILAAHPRLVYAMCMASSSPPPAAKRRKTGN